MKTFTQCKGLVTYHTAERTGERIDPFKAGSALPPSEGTGLRGGTEKIKAAAFSVVSWRCFTNIHTTEGGGCGGLTSPLL